MLKDLEIFKEMYEFMLWLYPTVKKFPKSEKYVMGERIETTALNVMEGIIASNCQFEKKQTLKKTSVELEKLRIFMRLAKDLKLMSFRKYEIASKMINEIGKMLGGLIKKFTQQHSE